MENNDKSRIFVMLLLSLSPIEPDLEKIFADLRLETTHRPFDSTQALGMNPHEEGSVCRSQNASWTKKCSDEVGCVVVAAWVPLSLMVFLRFRCPSVSLWCQHSAD